MNYPEKHIAILCNPTRENEKALRVSEGISLLLKGMSIPHHSFTSSWPPTLDPFTEIWVVGGDGTLNWFINSYPNIQVPLTVFAGGTGNDFHWMLYGDIGVEEQVDLVLHAEARSVDAGRCNDQLFLNGVGIGFDGAIVRDLVGKKKLAGKASYLLSIMKHILAYQEKHCTLKLEKETISQDTLLISVANARRYGGGFNVAPQAQLNDGLLDLNVIGRISPFNRMRYLPVIERGEHLALPFTQYRQTGSVKVTSEAELHAHVDGEYLYEKSFDIEILPKRFSFLY